MSEHTKGRLVVLGNWLVPEAHADRMIGGSTKKSDDKALYAHQVATVRGKYQDDGANARRFAACWNKCIDLSTKDLETGATLSEICERSNGYQVRLSAANDRITKLEAQLQQQDALLGKKACATKECRELLAVRALLREILAFGLYEQGATDDMDSEGLELTARAKSYLNACDTLEGK